MNTQPNQAPRDAILAVTSATPHDRRARLRRTARLALAIGLVVAGLALLLLLLLSPARARAALSGGAGEDILIGGTTTYDETGRAWAYLSWQSRPEVLRSLQVAIYAKEGDASSKSSYTRQAVVRLQTDPLVIQPLLQRSAQIGQNLAELDSAISSLFEKLTPDPTLPLAQKLAAVIRGSLDQPDQFKNLVLMSRVHPGAGLSLGWAHAAPMPGPAGAPMTFEIRAFDAARDQDLAVLGRVTLRAGQPVVLPAPGRPVEIPDTSARGDLNARFRWATPDALRRLSMLQHGFNVYRVPATLAQQSNWHAVAPTPAALVAATRSQPAIRRVNRVPVLNPRDYTEAEAADLVADASTFFFSDWNDRFNPNTTVPQAGFTNGAQFYYFLTARDLLGRDGLVSPGTLVTICDRLPPQAPQRVRVVNHYAPNGGVAPEQRLQVIWEQNPSIGPDPTIAYYLYRWTSLTQMHAHAGDPAYNRIAGPLAPVPNSPTNSWLDAGPGAPDVATAAGTTFWYTVVALDNGACAPGGNRSPHSAPAFGVLRDRTGPGAPAGDLEITCTEPRVTFAGVDADVPSPTLSTNARHYRLIATRDRPGVAWAEFHYDLPGINTQRTFVARQLFPPGASSVSANFDLPRAGLPPAASPRFHARIGASNGRISDFASSSTVGPTPDYQTRPVRFTGTMESRRTAPDGDCDVHDPHGDGDGDGALDGVCVKVSVPKGARELKYYRRVENGPLTLVCQREATAAAEGTVASCCDGGMPAQPSDLCYFVQAFDEHGNGGPMIRVGCIRTGPNAPLPTPILSPLTALGTSTNSRMQIQWFCPPYGVERFEVWIAGQPLPPAPKLSPDLTLTNTIELGLPLPGIVPDPKLMTFLSRRIGPAFGQGPVFTTEADVIPGNHYAIFIRAVGRDGSVGPQSNLESFRWLPTPESPAGGFPWPARPLPALSKTNFPGIAARLFRTNDDVFLPFPQQRFEGVGIRVGTLTMPQYPAPLTNAIPGSADPLDHVYRSARDQRPLFPVVVYRTQVTNAAFPTVSGDVHQVSPLMEEIAFDRVPLAGGAQATLVHDPFVRLIPTSPTPGARDWELYLLDTQPVVEDAAYQYFLVRLDPDTREILEITSTAPVLVTP